VRIGGFQSFLANVLAPSLPAWRGRFPSLTIHTVEADEEDLLAALRPGGLDAVIVEPDAASGYSAPRGMTDIPLLDEPWKLVVPSGSLLGDVMDIERLGLPWLEVHSSAASA
jgi:DNA-binding transcriptional LysR family regulator